MLTQQNTNFKLKKVWKRDDDDRNHNAPFKMLSMRFSSEISLLIEIIFTALNSKLSQLNRAKQRGKVGGKGSSNEEMIAQKILGLIFHRMIRKISSDDETLMLYLYPYLRETKK